MKRVFAWLLAVGFLVAAGSALAEVDLGYLDQYPNTFMTETIGDSVVVCDTLSARDLAFLYESDALMSYTYFRLRIPSGADLVYPELKLVYTAETPLNLTAVSFDVGDYRYTFKPAAVGPEPYESGFLEECTITFAGRNTAFLSALAEAIIDADATTVDDLLQLRVSAVLHGDRDVTVTLSEAFLLDFYMIFEDAYFGISGPDSFDRLTETTWMTMEPLPDL